MKIGTVLKARDLLSNIEKHEKLIEYVHEEHYKTNTTTNYNSYKNSSVIEALTRNYVTNVLTGYKNELSIVLDKAKF